MSEAEIIYQLSELYDRWWVILQWWVAISFGVLALAHFATKKLNYLITGIIVLLYTAFSVGMYGLLDYNEQIIFAFQEDLREMQVTENLVSRGANAYVDSTFRYERFEPILTLAVRGTFLGVICYLIYTVVRRKRRENT